MSLRFLGTIIGGSVVCGYIGVRVGAAIGAYAGLDVGWATAAVGIATTIIATSAHVHGTVMNLLLLICQACLFIIQQTVTRTLARPEYPGRQTMFRHLTS